MANLPGKARREYVRKMFARVAPHYDRANRWLTMGQNSTWRNEVLKLTSLPNRGRLLDIGTGTGDLALHAAVNHKSALVVGMDFSPEMMDIGRKQDIDKTVCWLIADALVLPFSTGYFDTVISGYLVRNVIDIMQAVAEQYRVLRAGGRMVCLETTPLPNDLLHLPARVYERYFMPLIGQLVAGNREAYKYLPSSTKSFLSIKGFAELMTAVGFVNVRYRTFMAGTMAIHWGDK